VYQIRPTHCILIKSTKHIDNIFERRNIEVKLNIMLKYRNIILRCAFLPESQNWCGITFLAYIQNIPVVQLNT